MPVDLRGIRSDPLCPARLEERDEVAVGVDVGVRAGHRDLAHELGMGGEQRPEPAVTGQGSDELERRPSDEHRVTATVPAVVCRDGEGPRQIDAGRQQRAHHVGGQLRLVTQDQQGAANTGIDGRHAHLDRARQAARWVRIADAPFAPPSDGVLDRVGVDAKDDDDVVQPRRRQRVEDVLQDRPPLERRNQLAAPEPRTGSGREYDRRDLVGTHELGLVGPAGSVGVEQPRRRLATPAAGRLCPHPSPRHDLDRGVALARRVLDERDEP